VDLNLAGKVVIVTGGTDGLGAAAAERLLVEGARVSVCGRDADRLGAARSRLALVAGADAVMAEQADVTEAGDIERLVAATADRWGRIDGLVNNAGTSRAGDFESIDDDSWHHDLDLKLMAAVRTTRAVVPHLRAAGGGAVVNVLNHLAKTPAERTAPTSVSRAAGLALTKVLSKEFGPDAIRVNAVLIGRIVTGQTRRMAAARQVTVDELEPNVVDELGIPLGRLGRAEEFADLVAFLLSDRGAYISGTGINLDGGLCATT
jgi:NAD(P)-dependent dehydrogenase (short-subunit alcohol dehydrogenase family)